MTKGTIKKIMGQRGFGFYGFIGTEAGSEYFFHIGSLDGARVGELREGSQVEFTAESDSRGRDERAVHVRLTGG